MNLSKLGTPFPSHHTSASTILYLWSGSSTALSDINVELGSTLPFYIENPSGTFHFFTYRSITDLFLSFFTYYFLGGSGYFAYLGYLRIVNLVSYNTLLLKVANFLDFYFNFS